MIEKLVAFKTLAHFNDRTSIGAKVVSLDARPTVLLGLELTGYSCYRGYRG